MMIYENNPDKSIYALEKSQAGGRTVLKWKSLGHAMFLILLGEDRAAVDLREDKKREAFSNAFTPLVMNQLKEEKEAPLKELNLRLFLLSHNELMRNGGLPIQEKPGVYAVYGVETERDEGPVLYTPEEKGDSANVFVMLLEVSIEQKPYFIEKKSLFSKKSVYSGYFEVRISKPLPGLAAGALKYTVGDITFPFPDCIVKSGGAFYVKNDQDTPLSFVTANQGIRIK